MTYVILILSVLLVCAMFVISYLMDCMHPCGYRGMHNDHTTKRKKV